MKERRASAKSLGCECHPGSQGARTQLQLEPHISGFVSRIMIWVTASRGGTDS
jgi:hypothetical protein